MRRTVTVSVIVLALLAAGVLLGTRWHPGGNTATGTGFTYAGQFYWASGKQVKDSALGAPVASAVPFQDTTADVRMIVGLSPGVALAALLPSLDGSPGGLRWTLVSPDQGRGTDPRSYAETNAVLVPSP